jgi:hypothetical protein
VASRIAEAHTTSTAGQIGTFLRTQVFPMVYRALGQVIGWWNDHAAEIRQVVTVINGAVKVAVSSGPTGSDPSTAIIAELRQQNAHLPGTGHRPRL